MFKAAAALITAILTAMATGCFGPLDPTNPPPARTENSDDTSHTTTSTHAPGLIAWWTCNDSSTTRLKDSLGKFNGQISGCTVDSGIEGAGLRFSGSGSSIGVYPPTGDSSFDFNAGDFTVSLWVKPMLVGGTDDTMNIIARGETNKTGFVLTIIEKRFTVFLGEQKKATLSEDDPLEYGVFQHIVLTRHQGEVIFFVNSKETISFTSTESIHFDGPVPLFIGRDNSNSSNNNFNGLIDEIKLLDMAWGIAEVDNEYKRFR